MKNRPPMSSPSSKKKVSAPPAGDKRLKTLDRVLSKAGFGSRNDARRWVEEGRVSVNGATVRDPDQWIDLDRDRVALDRQPITARKREYLLLFKPKGYLTTYSDKEGRPTVYDLLPAGSNYLFPVGRLDLDTSGLLIMTNDSEFAEQITNPDFKVPKTYLVTSSTNLTDEQLDLLRRGVELRDGATRPAIVNLIKQTFGKTIFELTISEGRNRQVRRMLEAVDSSVEKLVRVAIGPVRIGELASGHSRPLTAEELAALRSIAAPR
jgi:pseudouridine synthase